MEIGGFQRVSLIDYPGKITSIVFLLGCNIRCPFCHNPDLVLKNYKNLRIYDQEEILGMLERSRVLVEAVEITGGEPTLSSDLPAFIERCKALGLKVKLDTNGTNPEYLRRLLEKGIIDYIAMDIKAVLDPEKYKMAIGVKNYFILDRIKESIGLIMSSGIEYEFRTTVVPGIVEPRELMSIAKDIKGAQAYYLQQFVPSNTLDPSFSRILPYGLGELTAACEEIKRSRLVQKCEVRSRSYTLQHESVVV